MSEHFEIDPNGQHRQAELLTSITDEMQKLGDMVAGERETTSMSSYRRLQVPGIGRISWLQVYHELHIKIAQQRDPRTTAGVEIDRYFDVTTDGCRARVDEQVSDHYNDQVFKIAMKDTDTNRLRMFWVDQSDGGQRLVDYNGGPGLPDDELEAFARLPVAIAAELPALLDASK